MQSKMMVGLGTAVVALSFVLSACGGGTTESVKTDPVTAITSTSLSINGFNYSPKTTTIKVGSDITFPATADHPLVGLDEGNSNPIPTAESIVPQKITFTKTGTFKFKCIRHDGLGMNGTITVTN
jgi:plastocyanin